MPIPPESPRTASRTSHRTTAAVAVGACAALSLLLGLLCGPAAAQRATASSSRPAPARHSATGSTLRDRRVPPVNRRALAVARSKIGHRYVFGAAGPRTFDCSGLMHFSYARAGRHIPRIADAQFHAARRIARRQLRPGDLVFYHRHGHRGRVFHVGMFVSPGRTVAAVDPAEGVTWQRIHYPNATFGSFTHR